MHKRFSKATMTIEIFRKYNNVKSLAGESFLGQKYNILRIVCKFCTKLQCCILYELNGFVQNIISKIHGEYVSQHYSTVSESLKLCTEGNIRFLNILEMTSSSTL